MGTITDGIIRTQATTTAPESGTINTLHFYSSYSGTGTNCLVRPVLYQDGASPALVTYGGEVSYSSGTEEWKTLDITDDSITASTGYLLGVWVNSTSGGNACRYRWDSDASYRLKSDTFTYHSTNPPSDPLVVDATLTSRRMSLYGTYTADEVEGEPSQVFQKLNYTYDDVGNITQITDYSDTGTGKIAQYTYDDLHRLTNASTTVASSTPFTHTYTYSKTGNIATSTPAGEYFYAGTGYTNPHAATTINGVSLSYDRSGNLTNYGSNTYGWNYRNELTRASTTNALMVYDYDHTGQRVRSYNQTTNENRHTPNKFYNVGGLEAVKHIFAGNDLIATVASSSAPNTIALTATSTDISTGFTSGPSTKNIAHTTSGSNRLLVLL